jgi:hypothetical protein
MKKPMNQLQRVSRYFPCKTMFYVFISVPGILMIKTRETPTVIYTYFVRGFKAQKNLPYVVNSFNM